MHDQHRQRQAVQARAGVVREACLHLRHDHRDGHGPALRDLQEARIRLRVCGHLRRDVDLPCRPQRPLAVAGQHRLRQPLPDAVRAQGALGAAAVGAAQRERAHALGMGERELLRHHAAHGDAEHVRRLDAEGLKQAGGIVSQLADRERAVQARAGAHAAVIVGDHLELARQLCQERFPPVQRGAAHAHDQEQRGARTAALAVELDLADANGGHAGDRSRSREPAFATRAARAARPAHRHPRRARTQRPRARRQVSAAPLRARRAAAPGAAVRTRRAGARRSR